MTSNSILIGRRDETHRDREFYIIDKVGTFEYEMDKGSNRVNIVSELKFKDVQEDTDKCFKMLNRFICNYGSVIILDENLNRIGGDHCVRVGIRANKYTIDLQEIKDTEKCCEYDLLDYGVCSVYGDKALADKCDALSTKNIYRINEYGTVYGIITNSDTKLSSNVNDIEECGRTIRIELFRDDYSLRILTGYRKFSVVDDWYRIKCVNTISNIANKVICNKECYFAGMQNRKEIWVDKEFIDEALKKVRYVHIGGTKYDGERHQMVYCYDLVEQKLTTVGIGEVVGLIRVGEMVITLECRGAGKSQFEYVPLPNGMFINSKGDMITHKEMEEYFLGEYGYFIDLYNTYRMAQETKGYIEWERLEYYSKNIDFQRNDCLYKVMTMTSNEIRECGIIGDKYTEVNNMKIKNEKIFYDENVPVWVTVENMRGNEIELRQGKLLRCNLAKSLTLRGVNEILCDINIVRDAEDVNIEILDDLKRILSGIEVVGECSITTSSISNFKSLNTRVCGSYVLIYNGEINYENILYIISTIYDKMYTSYFKDGIRVDSDKTLGYEDTYNILAEIVRIKQINTLDNLKIFIECLWEDWCDVHILDRGAMEDIIIDHKII